MMGLQNIVGRTVGGLYLHFCMDGVEGQWFCQGLVFMNSIHTAWHVSIGAPHKGVAPPPRQEDPARLGYWPRGEGPEQAVQTLSDLQNFIHMQACLVRLIN